MAVTAKPPAFSTSPLSTVWVHPSAAAQPISNRNNETYPDIMPHIRHNIILYSYLRLHLFAFAHTVPVIRMIPLEIYPMIDTTTHDLITLTEATKHLPRFNGKRIAVSTIWRWCRHGCRGISLPYVRLGRRMLTSREAVDHFSHRLAEIDADVVKGPEWSKPQSRTQMARSRAIQQAQSDLKADGI